MPELLIRFLRACAPLRLLFPALGFWGLISCEARPPAHITDPGQLIYLGYINKQANCSRCHGEEGQGGMFGPNIRGVLQKKGADYVRETILLGKGEDEMPALAEELTAEQIEQVIRYLAAWGDSSAAP